MRLSRLAIVILALTGLAVILIVWTECRHSSRESDLQEKPFVAEPTKRLEGVQFIPIPYPVPIQLPAPKVKVAERIREDYGVPDLVVAGPDGLVEGSLTGPLLTGEYTLPELPYGGSAISTLTDGRAGIVVKPNPAPFFEFPMRWRATALVEGFPEQRVTLAVGIRSLRLGRIELSPAGMVGYDVPSGESWVGAGVVATFDF